MHHLWCHTCLESEENTIFAYVIFVCSYATKEEQYLALNRRISVNIGKIAGVIFVFQTSPVVTFNGHNFRFPLA